MTLCTCISAGVLTLSGTVFATDDGGPFRSKPLSVSLAAFQDADAAPDKSEWKSHFQLGLGASAGNTDNQNFNAVVESVRETVEEKTKLDGAYFYAASNGDRTTNKLTAGILHDWLEPGSPWLYFATGRYDYDEFQSWEHRVGVHGGVGYHLIDKEDFDLTLRGGVGVTKEFGSIDEELAPEALFGVDLAWQITEKQKLEATSTIYPSLGDVGEFRAVSQADWNVVVDEESNMSMFVGLRHEYQSEVDPGVKKSDVYLTAGLQFDF